MAHTDGEDLVIFNQSPQITKIHAACERDLEITGDVLNFL